MKKALWFIPLVALVGAAVWWFWLRPAPPAHYRFAKVERGELRVTVTATGTVQPFLLVQVGTQVTGTIQKMIVDYNSKVKAGQVVAQIDPAPFQSLVDQNKANLARAESDVGRVRASLIQAEKELARARELQKKELISPSDLDAAVATYDSFVAQLKVAEATVDQSRAALESSAVNLRYCTISSPIDGVVISRNVDVGQTVAASLAAPTIYVIADDMKRIQVQASVAEADIGRIKEQMEVTFTVDAYRVDHFKGKVSQIRLSPTTVQNVVTYTVIIDADNKELKLLPGMTANVSFEIAQYTDVVKVPNAALRFTPPSDASNGGSAKHDPPSEAAGTKPGGKPDRERRNQNRVWLLASTGPVAVQITADATDGSYTRLLKGDLKEEDEVIIGLVQEGSDSMKNPFAPSMGGGGRGGR